MPAKRGRPSSRASIAKPFVPMGFCQPKGIASVTKYSACERSYGTGIVVQVCESGSWHCASTASTSSGRWARRVTTPSVSVGALVGSALMSRPWPMPRVAGNSIAARA